MKSTKKIISILLAALMTASTAATAITASASTRGTLCDKYATNPNNKVGISKTITVDGDASDWSEDMLIAQGAAWDVANNYKGGHENCVLDTYALFASWDNDNLYVGWQMVNTTDTWARSGDGPLSDGGRVLDVPLILALSVDENSTSMSNKNTNGGPIWGQQMGLSFDTHVDHLFYMSGKVGNGTPGMFTAVDDEGNTDYAEGLTGFADGGIKYAMDETNICSSIIGLDGSQSPDDIYDSNANWVDFKTFKGSAGTHDITYDSFYEISIPFSTLGITRNYLETNGIGAMLIATRGESALDCIPYDDTMLDNALKEYGKDPSTSHEKDDEDVITSDFAKIGNIGGNVKPTTAPPTTAPSTTVKPTTAPSTTVKPTTAPSTTVKPTTAPSTTKKPQSTLDITATSNLFPERKASVSSNAKTVTVTYKLDSVMNLVNGLWELAYDPTVLRFDASKNEGLMPYIDEISFAGEGLVSGAFTNANNPYNFKTAKDFVTVTFDVVGKGSTTIDLNVKTLSVGDKKEYKNAVAASKIIDLSKVAGFTTSKINCSTAIAANQVVTTQPTTAPSTDITVNANSNIADTTSKVCKKGDQITVTYNLTTSMGVADTQWKLDYDTTKLSVSNVSMPKFPTAVINEDLDGLVKGNYSSTKLTTFNNSAFVEVTFDVIGTGSTDVNLDVIYIGLGYKTSSNLNVQYIVDHSKIQDITGVAGFANASLSASASISGGTGFVYGDANGDGEITVDDVTAIQKHLANISELSGSQLNAADTDHDGIVTILDATLIQKYIAGYVSSI